MSAGPNASRAGAGRRELLSTHDGRLAIAVYEPAPSSLTRSIAICPPLGEEQAHARGPLHQLAARLAEAGHRVTLYDPRGHGDSEGDFSDVRISGLVADLATITGAVDVIVAVRFGAVVAAVAIQQALVRPARLLLVAPVLSGRSYARDVLRKNVAAQITATGRASLGMEELQARLARGGSIDMDGHDLGPKLYRDLIDQARVLDALSSGPASDVSVDVITFAPLVSTARAAPNEVSELSRRRPETRVEAIREAAFWKEDRRLVVTDLPALSARLISLLGSPPASGRAPIFSSRRRAGEEGA